MILQTHALSPLQGRWEGFENVLRPAGPQAAAVHGLWRFQIIVATIVWVLVVAGMLYAIARARGARADGTEEATYANDGVEQASTRTMRQWVIWSTALTVLILFVYLIYDYSVGRATAVPLYAPNALHIRVIGHQWWWEVIYPDTGATSSHTQLTTANEIHIPTGRPVIFELESSDVIHSFWIPNLGGKKDLVPGHRNFAWFTADTPGVYRGQCGEFCGYEHAKMALVVVAQAPSAYDAWYTQQLQPAAPPTDSLRVQGERVFLTGACALCHEVAGTLAGGHTGPSLTHVGSRLGLAANIIPNTRGNIAGWVVDPQRIKPGAQMPANSLSPQNLRALVAYLEGLK